MQRRPLPSLLYKSFFYGCNIGCLTFSLFHLRNSGNPAAVCLLEDDISDQLKQQIAAEMNISETAFLTRLHGDQGYEPGKIGLKTFIFKIYWEVSIDNELCIKHKIDKSIFNLRICEKKFLCSSLPRTPGGTLADASQTATPSHSAGSLQQQRSNPL